jgi:hypothetical protein
VATKAFRHVAGALVVYLALRGAVADSLDPKGVTVDVSAARVLLLKDLPQVPWLLRETPRPLGAIDLATLVFAPDARLPQEANSEQRQPLHVGTSPREQLLLGRRAQGPRLPLPLKVLAERQASQLLDKLKLRGEVDIEAWPTQNDVGRLTWVMSRYRRGKDAPWQWLNAALLRDEKVDPDLAPAPQVILPQHVSLASPSGETAIFADFFAKEVHDLYEKPLFSQCVFTTADKRAALAAWRPSVERQAQQDYFLRATSVQRKQVHCIALPPPARIDQKPLTLHLRVRETAERGGRQVEFVEPLAWIAPPAEQPLPQFAQAALAAAVARLPSFPPSFEADFRRDLAMLSGETPLPGAGAPAGVRLLRKNSADPRHQLEVLVDYLEARYQQLGLLTRRQRFVYRGIAQSNLVAILPGKTMTDGSPVKPAIGMADHIDTAFCEDVFARRGQRVSSAGADDNSAATAALLRAAEVLQKLPSELRQHDIWFVHLTGEEFPSDDLRARHFVSELFQRRLDLGALFVLDMIGSNPKKQPEYQLNAGGYDEAGGISMRLAQLAAQLSPRVATGLSPQVYGPTDLRSYLYNTDGLIFAEAGFSVVHVSEVMNRYLLSRPGYHDTNDTLQHVDIAYAAGIAKVTIATVGVLSQIGIPDPR